MDLKEIAINKGERRHPWELARVKVVTRILQTLPNIANQNLTILDVGSGDTFLIQELSKKFKKASFFAIDTGYDNDYITLTNKQFEEQGTAIKVFNDLKVAEKQIGQSIDIILLLDVIEHVADDIAFLKELSTFSRVNEQTLFLITVPAYQSLFCSHDVFLQHYRRYNNKLLNQNISKARLKVLNIGYFFTFPLLPRTVQVIKEKLASKKENPTGIGNWEGNQLISNLLEKMLLFDFSVSVFFRKLKIKLPGLSNFAICKKSV